MNVNPASYNLRGETSKAPQRSEVGESKQHAHMRPSPGVQRRVRNKEMSEYRVSITKSLPKSVMKRTSQQKSVKKGAEMIRKAFEIGPFEGWIGNVLPGSNLKFPQFVLYNRRTKPQEHIYRYKSAMSLVTSDEAILCKAFPNTLTEKALTWFTSLKADNIDPWYMLEKRFLDKFSTAGELPKTRGDLTNVK